MDSQSEPVVSAAKLPILNPNEFDLWKMRIEQYFLMTDYSLWEVIINGDSVISKVVVDGVAQPVTVLTLEQKLARKNELKAHGTLLMALPDKHQLKFNSHKDAKTLMEKLVSQLEIHGVSLSQEDVNLKFLRSLPSEWKTHTLIWRNKANLEEHSLDDLFNKLKLPSESKDCQSNIDAARLKLKLFKNIAAAEDITKIIFRIMLHGGYFEYWKVGLVVMAEAVNTAYYVQNRVLVTKPHNKTPYELLHGRLPSIGFMRPFGCPVTILNTLDPLGKFQGKVDEGFLVGYSVCSKAFRVFNSRTRIVHETLHVNFMENKPNVAGSSLAWLFDIDSLTQTMNYLPVTTENQTNTYAGLQDTKKAGKEGTHTNVLFPVLFDGSTNSQNNNKDAHADGKEHDDNIQKSVSPDIHSSSSGTQTRNQGDKTENKDKGKSHVVTIIRFRDLNEEFEECINNSSNGANAAGSSVSTAGLNFTNSTNDFSVAGPSNTVASPPVENSALQNVSTSSHYADMPNLEDYTHSDDADDVDAEADINNLESTIS
nr:retrovirus-related Pol polyprotein from transposon TNT 1-94 [Tanacetum cinerariifolium]